MGELLEKLRPLIEEMEKQGKTAKNLAEIEAMIIREGKTLLGTAFETLAEQQQGISPPKVPLRQGDGAKGKTADKSAKPVGRT